MAPNRNQVHERYNSDRGDEGIPPDESDEAMKWASELTEALKSQTPAIRFLPTSKEVVFTFEIDGVISAKEIPEVSGRPNFASGDWLKGTTEEYREEPSTSIADSAVNGDDVKGQ